MKTRGFEIVTEYKDKNINLPVRKTKHSAGYDFESAETVVVPSILENFRNFLKTKKTDEIIQEIKEKGLKAVIKEIGFKPTLVPTGIKAYMKDDEMLLLYNRSSNPLKKGLILSNSVGVIDKDYYNNEDNEGHIYFQFINFLPFSVTIEKGEPIGQGIFQTFLKADGDKATKTRKGGHGSTDENKEENKEEPQA